ncbi:uncharacterized protein LOC114533933 [Dendronephthya gigantea]|uniref:uncharacterized protein LOC114533933 n=1 Tax=Dendronephthya gigantea TaxID=151771 RepID=UPI001069EC92|nr:uncharacterized protein LOC114533933 [Dendronephthya gigantea]XP_028411366.1 uncharacterized protein LOC114533933 [Dendronephthya gigantea]
MATSFQAHIDRENIGNSGLKKNVTKASQGQRGLSTKTPRKALGDLGNIQNGTGKKNFQTPKPSKVKISDENQKSKSSVKPKRGTFSVLNTHKKQNKTLSDVKIKTNNESVLPEIGTMIPFVDEEKDLPRPEHITKLLKHTGLLNPSLLIPPVTYQDDIKLPSSFYEFDSHEIPLFDDTIANILGFDEKPELVEVDPLLPVLEPLPPFEEDLDHWLCHD